MDYVKRNAEERGAPEILKTKRGRTVKAVRDFEARREEIKKLLLEHEYGYIPEKPDHQTVKLVAEDRRFCAGKAVHKSLKITVTVGEEEFSFPVEAVIPNTDKKLPAFVHINFRPSVPDQYMPSEEIADRGYAVFSFCHNQIIDDEDPSFKKGIGKLLSPRRRTLTSPGKIAIWAWAAMRVMDYIETLDCIDLDNVAVVGHSRLGKTALLTGAFDERFKYVISNNSGCSGAALLRGKTGENLAILATVRSHWFCPRFEKYAVFEDRLPLDQHFLLAAIAPRHILIGSAEGDVWSDPESEFIAAYLASEVYEKIYKLPGLVHEGKIPEATTSLDEGYIHYHIRKGLHYFSREDWTAYMNYIDKCMKK